MRCASLPASTDPERWKLRLGLATRPTSDRLRETLFNVLAPRIEGAVFLDLYAGSGAVGIEALSRGAAERGFCGAGFRCGCGAAEKSGQVGDYGGVSGAYRKRWGLVEEGCEERCIPPHGPGSACGLVRKTELPRVFDLVFLDPPYDAVEEYAATLGLLGGGSVELLAPGALVIAEHRRKERLEERYGELGRTRLLEQGDAALSFYAVGRTASSE